MGRRLKKIFEENSFDSLYAIDEGADLAINTSTAKFQETIDICINLNIDPKKGDQNVRGKMSLPKSLGKTVKVCVIAKEEKLQEAKDAGADIVGGDDLVEKIEGGFLDFDRCISTPDMMPKVGKLGKVLGPRNLMPNPKLGSVTEDLKTAVSDAKSGQAEIRNDKDGNIGVSIGKKSFNDEQLIKNYKAILETLEKEKSNNTVKGDLIKSAFITSTMGVSYKLKLEKSI